LKNDGTEIFIQNLRNPTQTISEGELNPLENDICVSREALAKLALSQAPNLFENSLL
jgi:hypothetical protein